MPWIPRTRHISAAAFLAALLLQAPRNEAAPAEAAPAETVAAAPVTLWEIGKSDDGNAEFALAPGSYSKFGEDGFFVVGRSDAKRDWPYVQPGPADGWAGSRAHTFSIAFGLEGAPPAGEYRLRIDLLDTQHQIPPPLAIEINGRTFRQETPRGAGDASVFGDPARGKEHIIALEVPADLLRSGTNTIDITTLAGSWILYDAVRFDAPAGTRTAPVDGTVLSSARSEPALVERAGKMLQTVHLGVRRFGEATKARLSIVGAGGEVLASVDSPLESGIQSLTAAVPAVEKETALEAVLEVDGKTIGKRSLTLKPVRRWVVYLLPHSHVDIGYTHVQTEVEQAQWKYLEMAMEAARKTADYPEGCRFKWNVEVLWAVDGYLRQATPEKREAFYQAVRDGQVGLDALYGNMLTGLCREEELMRLLRMGTELTQRTGVPVESAMITDVPGYTWGMVPAFAHSGVKYFSIGPNGGDRIGRTIAAWGDKPFWWMGPNGKDRVLVWMTGTGYYRVFSSGENLMAYLGRLEEQGYPYDHVQVRHCLGDNGAPDVNFADTVREWNATHAYPKLVIATTAGMFRDFEKRYGESIPSAKGDFTPYWEDGAASSARETALNRRSADRLLQAESLYAMLQPKAYRAEDFYHAWRNVVLYDEHTWGAHNSISEPDHPFVKSQWAIKQAFALDGEKQSRALIQKANESRGGKPEAPSGGPMDSIDVVNTTGNNIANALIVVPPELSRAGNVVRSSLASEEGRPSQRLTTGELVFVSCWPAFTARRLYVTPGTKTYPVQSPARAEGTTLSTKAAGRDIALCLDATTGAIASLVVNGRELVDAKASTALNDYLYLPGSDASRLERNGPVKISVKEQGPLVASLLVESAAPGTRSLTREVRLVVPRGQIEIIDTVDKTAVRAKEGVHLGFGFQVPDGTVRMDVPWAIVRPELDQIPGACKNWFTIQRWVDISGPSSGVTWISPDAPLVEVGGLTADRIGSLSDPNQWIGRLEPSQTIYSWVMNNHWHTNYRAEQEGPTTFRYVIVPHQGRFEATTAAARAREVCQPILVLPARGEIPKEAPLSIRGKLDGGPFQITTFKPSDDGKAWIVRFQNLSETTDEAQLTWRAPGPKAIWMSDNSERPIAPAKAAIECGPWSIVTIRADMP